MITRSQYLSELGRRFDKVPIDSMPMINGSIVSIPPAEGKWYKNKYQRVHYMQTSAMDGYTYIIGIDLNMTNPPLMTRDIDFYDFYPPDDTATWDDIPEDVMEGSLSALADVPGEVNLIPLLIGGIALGGYVLANKYFK